MIVTQEQCLEIRKKAHDLANSMQAMLGNSGIMIKDTDDIVKNACENCKLSEVRNRIYKNNRKVMDAISKSIIILQDIQTMLHY